MVLNNLFSKWHYLLGPRPIRLYVLMKKKKKMKTKACLQLLRIFDSWHNFKQESFSDFYAKEVIISILKIKVHKNFRKLMIL